MDEQTKNDFGRSPGQQFGASPTSTSQRQSFGGQNKPERQTHGQTQGQTQSQPQSGGRFGASAIAEEALDTGKRIGKEVGREAAQEGKEIAGDIRHLVDDYAQAGKQTVSERLHHMSTALHRAADSLRQENEQATGRIADQAADRIDQVCNYLENHEPADLLQGVNRFARQQPYVVVGGLLVAGLLLGRFLRSSEQSRGSFSAGSGSGHSGSDDDDDRFGSGRQIPENTGFGGPTRVGMGINSNPALRPRGTPEASGHIGAGPEIGTRIGGTGAQAGMPSRTSGQQPGQQTGQQTGQQSGQQTGNPVRPLTSRPLTEPPRDQNQRGQGDRGGA